MLGGKSTVAQFIFGPLLDKVPVQSDLAVQCDGKTADGRRAQPPIVARADAQTVQIVGNDVGIGGCIVGSGVAAGVLGNRLPLETLPEVDVLRTDYAIGAVAFRLPDGHAGHEEVKPVKALCKYFLI